MWKKGLSVVNNENVFHIRCGKYCGNLRIYVEKNIRKIVFHISTGHQLNTPVEMWKTYTQSYDFKELNL